MKPNQTSSKMFKPLSPSRSVLLFEQMRTLGLLQTTLPLNTPSGASSPSFRKSSISPRKSSISPRNEMTQTIPKEERFTQYRDEARRSPGPVYKAVPVNLIKLCGGSAAIPRT